jgi:hypothetical protein
MSVGPLGAMGAGSTPQMVRDGDRVEVAADDAGLTRGGGLGAADDAVAALLQQLREAAVPVVGGGALGIGGLLPAASSPGRRTTYRVEPPGPWDGMLSPRDETPPVRRP